MNYTQRRVAAMISQTPDIGKCTILNYLCLLFLIWKEREKQESSDDHSHRPYQVQTLLSATCVLALNSHNFLRWALRYAHPWIRKLKHRDCIQLGFGSTASLRCEDDVVTLGSTARHLLCLPLASFGLSGKSSTALFFSASWFQKAGPRAIPSIT